MFIVLRHIMLTKYNCAVTFFINNNDDFVIITYICFETVFDFQTIVT